MNDSVELLKLEFEYARETAMQATQDRLTMVNFYIALYAGVGTVALGLNEALDSNLSKYLPLFFIFLGLISYIFILQMVRLRQAWLASIAAMNQIKGYFYDKDKKLSQYIRWGHHTIPKAEKFKSVHYYSALLIAILGTTGIGIGLTMLGLSLFLTILLSLIFFGIVIGSFHFMLKYDI